MLKKIKNCFTKIILSEFFSPLVIVFFFILLSIIIYIKALNNITIINSLSGISTFGLFILTAFYVIYTNKQIKELKNTRELQVQPLPIINFETSCIISPQLRYDPHNGELFFCVDLPIKYKIKNIGNGSAVCIDIYFKYMGKKIRFIPNDYYANRIQVLENGQEIESIYSLRDEKYEIIHFLSNQDNNKICKVENILDVIFRVIVLYKNIVGASFKFKIDYVVDISNKNQDILSNWIILIESFEKKFVTEISKFKLKFERNKKEGLEYFDNLIKSFNQECPFSIIELNLMEIPQSFTINQIKKTKNEYDKIRYGIPIGMKHQNKKFKEFAKFIESRNENTVKKKTTKTKKNK